MGRVADMFKHCQSQSRGALMPFIVAGHPTPDSLGSLLQALESAGADAVEVGIPFSDPIADGPVIAAAMHEALVAGITVADVLSSMAAARASITIPVVAMVSISIVNRLGGAAFIDRLADSGFDGVILPDADLDSIGELQQRAEERGMAFTSLIAPDSSLTRTRQIAADAREFIYLLARRGLTGERSDAPDLHDRVASIRELTNLPLAAGFGISTPQHVCAVLGDADGAIVGSALVRTISEAVTAGKDPFQAARAFVEPLAQAAQNSPG